MSEQTNNQNSKELGAMDKDVLEIATGTLHVETLETRNWDRLDFYDMAVWSIRKALEQAWQRGRSYAESGSESKKIT